MWFCSAAAAAIVALVQSVCVHCAGTLKPLIAGRMSKEPGSCDIDQLPIH